MSGLCLAGAPGGYSDIGFAVGWSLTIGWPLLLEVTAMTVALAFNPECLGLTRRRKALVKAGRYALTVDFLVRPSGAPKGAGQRLMTSLQADWRRRNTIVVGYPANRGPTRFCVVLGARRDYPRGRGNGNAAWPSTRRRQRKGPLHDDHPHPELAEGLRLDSWQSIAVIVPGCWAVFRYTRVVYATSAVGIPGGRPAGFAVRPVGRCPACPGLQYIAGRSRHGR
jgi:hypothetical protein